MSPAVERTADAEASGGTLRRYADNPVHDLIAIANDLERHVMRALRARGYEDLRPSFAPLLSRIWHEELPLGRLAGELGVSAQAASQTVNLAERAGYVIRERNPNDRRSKLVMLSGLGRRFVAHGAEAIAERELSYAELIGTRRLSRFDGSLAHLRAELRLPENTIPVAAGRSRRSVGAVILVAEQAKDELRTAMTDGGHGAMRPTHHAVLAHVGARGARVSEIARAQGVSRQAISATLHEIESLGYLARTRDEHDGRRIVFMLTSRGIRLVDDYVRQLEAIERRYESALGPRPLEQFNAIARDLHHRLRVEAGLATRRVLSTAVAGMGSTRPERELVTLAADLRRWLGSTDAARLASVLSRPVEENERLTLPTPSAARDHRGARP